jgi:hypothetical protein
MVLFPPISKSTWCWNNYGTHKTALDLEAAIREFLSVHNGQPKPFRWTQSADHILASIARCPATTLAAHAPAIYARNQ